MTIQFTEGHFAEPYSPTIENTYHKILRVKGVEYAVEIVDTAGLVRRPKRHVLEPLGHVPELRDALRNGHPRLRVRLLPHRAAVVRHAAGHQREAPQRRRLRPHPPRDRRQQVGPRARAAGDKRRGAEACGGVELSVRGECTLCGRRLMCFEKALMPLYFQWGVH